MAVGPVANTESGREKKQRKSRMGVFVSKKALSSHLSVNCEHYAVFRSIHID